MPKITVKSNYCKGCELCMVACPKKIIKASAKINAKGYHYAEVEEKDMATCIACKMCYDICPDVAIQIEK